MSLSTPRFCVDQFLEEVDRTIRLGAKPNQIKIYDDVDILLIDDLEEIFGNREAEQVFTNLFLSSMNEKKKQILCTSSVLAKECGSKEMIRFFDRACMVRFRAQTDRAIHFFQKLSAGSKCNLLAGKSRFAFVLNLMQ